MGVERYRCTVVVENLTELICFEPEVCICDGEGLEINRENLCLQ